MGVVAFLLDNMEGHYLPSFRLAKDLQLRGHEICFWGLAGARAMVDREGFRFMAILESPGSGGPAAAGPPELFGQLLRGEALGGAVARCRPDVVLMLAINYSEALAVHFAHRLPIVFLATFCRPAGMTRATMIEELIAQRLMALDPAAVSAIVARIGDAGLRLSSFGDLAAIVQRMPELVLLPEELELPDLAREPQVHYVGAGIDLERREEPFCWQAIDGDRPLVYCSLGSHAEIAGDAARRLLRALVAAAAARPDRQFILSVGMACDPRELSPTPPNLHVSRWVPQLQVLRRAGLMVTHGGAGTVKECVLMGVPMVVVPLIRDQFEMARRVVHHGLGKADDARQATAASLGALIDQVAADGAMKQRLAAMRQRILTNDGARRGVAVVEAAMAGAGTGHGGMLAGGVAR